mmetsp:Transcript_46438/g.53843  ORF Transcript_46438/g.53843 Transcript_46438/m.53843 type:complete len:228 (+) Transcript_46438:70-753(+)
METPPFTTTPTLNTELRMTAFGPISTLSAMMEFVMRHPWPSVARCPMTLRVMYASLWGTVRMRLCTTRLLASGQLFNALSCSSALACKMAKAMAEMVGASCCCCGAAAAALEDAGTGPGNVRITSWWSARYASFEFTRRTHMVWWSASVTGGSCKMVHMTRSKSASRHVAGFTECSFAAFSQPTARVDEGWTAHMDAKAPCCMFCIAAPLSALTALWDPMHSFFNGV